MRNGIIKLDTKRGLAFGFTSNKFEGYLWKSDSTIFISFIVSRHEGKGNVRNLFEAIMRKGYSIWVPNPSVRMRMICEKFGGISEWIEDTEGMKISA